jgi:hypothetical protein
VTRDEVNNNNNNNNNNNMPVERYLWKRLNELRNINQINCYEALTKATVVMYQYT